MISRKTIQLLLDTLQLNSGLEARAAQERWQDVDTTDLLPLLIYEGAEIWCYRRLRQLGIQSQGALVSALKAKAQAASIQNMRADAQTMAVVARLDSASIPWALIKGQARRAAEARYPFATARTVSDVDLLVPEARADEAWQLLCDNGFERLIKVAVTWQADHHRPALIDANKVAVELHTTTSLAVSSNEAWRRATVSNDEVEWNGFSTRVPNATELLWQALSHLVGDGASGYSLRAFLSVACVLAVHPDIHWGVIESRIAESEVIDADTSIPVARDRVTHALAICANLAGVTVPTAIASTREVDLVPLLQWRAAVLTRKNGQAVAGRLLEEALRAEAMLPVTEGVPGTGPLKKLRRRTTSLVARAMYSSWRAFQ